MIWELINSVSGHQLYWLAHNSEDVQMLIISRSICWLWLWISIIVKFSHLTLSVIPTLHSFTLLLPGCCQCSVYGKTSLCKCFYLFSRFCILHDLSKLHSHHNPASPATILKSVFHLLEATDRLFKAGRLNSWATSCHHGLLELNGDGRGLCWCLDYGVYTE